MFKFTPIVLDIVDTGDEVLEFFDDGTSPLLPIIIVIAVVVVVTVLLVRRAAKKRK